MTSHWTAWCEVPRDSPLSFLLPSSYTPLQVVCTQQNPRRLYPRGTRPFRHPLAALPVQRRSYCRVWTHWNRIPMEFSLTFLIAARIRSEPAGKQADASTLWNELLWRTPVKNAALYLGIFRRFKLEFHLKFAQKPMLLCEYMGKDCFHNVLNLWMYFWIFYIVFHS